MLQGKYNMILLDKEVALCVDNVRCSNIAWTIRRRYERSLIDFNAAHITIFPTDS